MNKKILQGRVLSVRGRDIHLLYEKKFLICILKNSLLKHRSNQKNYICVGDRVIFNENMQITEILPRITTLQRMDPLNHRKRQIIAANIDQVFISFAIQSPSINIPMLDKYIIATQNGGLTPVIIINKIDLCEDRLLLDNIINIYKELDISIIALSVSSGEGIDQLLSALQGKTSIFSGPSGVGKTSLINLIAKQDLAVGDISNKIKKGTHTTTHSSLLSLDEHTFIIDSPGVASFSLFQPSKEDILDYFSDLNTHLGPCKYRGCTHTHEPFCMVKKAYEEGLIDPMRMSSFRSIIDEVLNKIPLY